MKFEQVSQITVTKKDGTLIAVFFEEDEEIKVICKDGYCTDIGEKKVINE